MDSQRSLNFDILRIMAMFFIVVFHFYVHGVMHQHTTPELGFAIYADSSFVEKVNYVLSEFIIVIVSTGVNLFVMISGFFLISRTSYRAKSLIRLWLKMFFYSLVIAIVFFLLGKAGFCSVISAFLPLSTGQYWFMVVYFGLMLVAPFLSRLACSLTQNQYKGLLVALFAINFIYPVGWLLSGGGTLLWFSFLFLLAGYLRLYPVKVKRMELKTIFVTAVVALLYILYPVVLYFLKKFQVGELSPIQLIEPYYNSLISFVSVVVFLRIKEWSYSPSNRICKAINYLVPSTLGVYLISDNRFVRNLLWEDIYCWQHIMNSIWAIPIILSVSFFIFIITLLIDVIVERILCYFKIEDRIYEGVINLKNKYANRYIQ